MKPSSKARPIMLDMPRSSNSANAHPAPEHWHPSFVFRRDALAKRAARARPDFCAGIWVAGNITQGDFHEFGFRDHPCAGLEPFLPCMKTDAPLGEPAPFGQRDGGRIRRQFGADFEGVRRVVQYERARR